MKLRLVAAAICCASVLGVGFPGVADARPIAPPPDAPVVTAGTPCTPLEAGDVGTTGTGPVATSWLVCIKAPGDPTLRWRPLDSSTHRLVGAIDRLYSAYFDRPLDAEGFTHWINRRATACRS